MDIVVVKHKDILFKELLQVIDIKNKAWNHPIESQLRWIMDNLDDEDEHVFLRDGSKYLAYLNLVKIVFTANDANYPAYGIGNVCATVRGKGYGRELMTRVNDYLKVKQHCGLLFCRDALVPFYNLYDWEEVQRDACEEPVLSEDVHVMTYLVPETIVSFKYQGKFF